jgi:metallo-beta-lactamase class B
MIKILWFVLFVIFGSHVFAQVSNDTVILSEDVILVKIAENAYMHVSYINSERWGRIGANGVLLINQGKAMLVDTPWNNRQTATLYNWVKDSMQLELTTFVPGHWHVDCMGGLEFLQQQGVESYANEQTIKIAQNEGLPLPDNGFTDSIEILLGNEKVKCFYLGAAHSTDNIVVYVPQKKLLFAGCMVKSLNARNLGNTTDGDLKEYPKTLQKVLNKFPDAKVVVPGHGKWGGKDMIEHTIKLANN